MSYVDNVLYKAISIFEVRALSGCYTFYDSLSHTSRILNELCVHVTVSYAVGDLCFNNDEKMLGALLFS